MVAQPNISPGERHKLDEMAGRSAVGTGISVFGLGGILSPLLTKWYDDDSAASLGEQYADAYREMRLIQELFASGLLGAGTGLVGTGKSATATGGRTIANQLDEVAEAAESVSVDIAKAKFAQTSYSEKFSSGGPLSGRTINEVAKDLLNGNMSPADVPIDVIVRDGNTLIINTRSSQALRRAGVPREEWVVVDRTGQVAFEERLSGQLARNNLTSEGTDLP